MHTTCTSREIEILARSMRGKGSDPDIAHQELIKEHFGQDFLDWTYHITRVSGIGWIGAFELALKVIQYYASMTEEQWEYLLDGPRYTPEVPLNERLILKRAQRETNRPRRRRRAR